MDIKRNRFQFVEEDDYVDEQYIGETIKDFQSVESVFDPLPRLNFMNSPVFIEYN